VLVLAENSLAIAFFVLFCLDGAARHRWVSFQQNNSTYGQSAISVLRYLATSQFWFESMQNWQSGHRGSSDSGVIDLSGREAPRNQSQLPKRTTPALKLAITCSIVSKQTQRQAVTARSGSRTWLRNVRSA
jgi:hypothetical protein